MLAMLDKRRLQDAYTIIQQRLGEAKTRSLLQDETLTPGPHAHREDRILASRNTTTTDQRAEIQPVGNLHGCHTCGTKDARGPITTDGKPLAVDLSNKVYGTWIADHQPPKKLVKQFEKPTLLDFSPFEAKHGPAAKAQLDALRLDVTVGTLVLFNQEGIRLYPHCSACSVNQSGRVRAVQTAITNAMKARQGNKSFATILNAYTNLKVKVDDLLADKLIRTAHDNAKSYPGSESNATPVQKREVNRIGGNTAENPADGVGCHSCGTKDPREAAVWIGDHQPPTALYQLGLRDASEQYLYPHCVACSNKQATITAKIKRVFHDIVKS